MKRRLQFPAPSPQQPQGHAHGLHLLTEAEACARVKVFDQTKHPVRQFREWAQRAGVPVKHVGIRRVYDPRVLDAFLDGHVWTRRHRRVG